MEKTSEFQVVYDRLKNVLAEYEGHMKVSEGDAEYSLNAPPTAKHKKEMFFGAVQVRKNYVSFHLMPVYIYPDLLQSVSPALRKRMQGKSCFNFRAVDEDRLAELAALARIGFDRFKEDYL